MRARRFRRLLREAMVNVTAGRLACSPLNSRRRALALVAHVSAMDRPVALVIGTPSPRHAEIVACVSATGCNVVCATINTAAQACRCNCPDLVLIAAASADAGGELTCLTSLHNSQHGARFLFLASVSSEELAIAALNCGTERYVKEPWTSATLQLAISDLLPHDTVCASPQCCNLKFGDRFIGRSAASQQLRAQLARISPCDSSVLITGETGTGKEVVAELIHHNSKRADKPLVCLNMAAIPEALVESELFGHERGAFTGAMTCRDGKLAAANGGTLFLDEVGDMSPAVQAKLLRAIESKSIYRVGGTQSMRLDVRIIAATNQDLERASNEGRFRSDLYYRLNVLRVRLPPLRERSEDIALLANHYLRQFSRSAERSVRGLSARALETLTAYHWPGNIRELRNVIEALMVNLAPETTGIVDIPSEVIRQLAFAVGAPTSERERLLQALTATKWNKSKAASQLHWSRMTLYRKMHEHEIELRR